MNKKTKIPYFINGLNMGGAEIDTEKVLICNNASKIMKEQFLLDRITIEHENFFNAIIKK